MESRGFGTLLVCHLCAPPCAARRAPGPVREVPRGTPPYRAGRGEDSGSPPRADSVDVFGEDSSERTARRVRPDVRWRYGV
ncbi:hypothetical protein GCM10010358_59570 [Streptomyces minutiscleroticus]|uniref:Uncharacterized protein n=1 Tax=Streptomyces minutiscleroticus TaxID=68238 RepID=A0A918NVC1_9ACTN|nr:hypothetical protein GCM10010358_59570 [Streptomyces minutiscleroticus]